MAYHGHPVLLAEADKRIGIAEVITPLGGMYGGTLHAVLCNYAVKVAADD